MNMEGAKNHDGRACARPSRSQRCYPLLGTRIKSVTWCAAGSRVGTQTGLVLATPMSGKPSISICEQDTPEPMRSN